MRVGGLESKVEPKFDAKAAFLPALLTTHTSSSTPPTPSLALLSSQEPKSPSYFLTKMCFITNHLVPFQTDLAGASVPC